MIDSSHALPIVDPFTFIAGRIVERYSHPSRTNYLYLFQLLAGADFAPIVPALSQIDQAWVDEGEGLQPIEVVMACQRCQATIDRLHNDSTEGRKPQQRDDRRRLMARQVSFSITAPAIITSESVVLVDLFSRAIAFTPKSDRRVTETWRSFEGGWYSAYKPPE